MNATQTERPPIVELGRYSVSGGERVLIGRRNDANDVEIYDTCAKRTGRTYCVERGGINSLAELAGVVKDYKAWAARIDAVPMRPGGARAHLAQVEHVVKANGR